MPYLLDTNHCIYLINGLEKTTELRSKKEVNVIKTIRELDDYESLYISEVTIGELYYGAFCSIKREQNLEKIQRLKLIVTPININEKTWEIFGETKSHLRQSGKLITDFDILIACTASQYDLVLVTNDKDFEALQNYIKMTDWTV